MGNDQNCKITMSSRIRLARNLSDFVFPGRIKKDDAFELLRNIKDVFFQSAEIEKEDYDYIDISKIDPIDKMMLVEKHLVSPELIMEGRPCAAIISKDETVSIMLNEEDHLRIQCISPSEDIDSTLSRCEELEKVFDKAFQIAFDPKFGYLTSCPTNLGTGMRASFMLHLPALVLSGHIHSVLAACGKIGVAVRGIYGENSEALGNMFQFSNQGSLGRNEEETLMAIKNVKSQIIGQEYRLRSDFMKQSETKFEDRVFRALGVLSNARILTSEEYMQLWSDVRLGVDMGVIEHVDIKMLDNMVIQIQPAYIQKMYGRMLNTEERNIQRATFVRQQFTQVG